MIAPLVSLGASVVGGLVGSLTGQDDVHAKAKKSAEDFESIFLAQILNTMSEGLGEDTGFDGGSAETQWRTLMNEYTAKSISGSGGIGLADGIMREILRAQGA